MGGELITATATDSAGNTSEFSGALVATGLVGPDLIAGGGPGNDLINLTAGSVIVTVNGINLGSFNPTGRIIARGLAGNDTITMSNAITLPAELYGDDGNDTLQGGGGNDQLFGGPGDDTLDGQGGTDTYDGGPGNNVLVSDASDNLGGYALTLVSPVSLPHDSTAVRGQPLVFSAHFPTPGSSVAWNFGDGRSATGANVNHAYVKDGSFAVELTVQGSGTTTIRRSVAITAVAMQKDPGDAHKTALAVGGTTGSDAIGFLPASGGRVLVLLNLVPSGIFAPNSRVIAYGQGGQDAIEALGLSLPAWLDGGDGNDLLSGGNDSDVLLGGAGNDLLYGGPGRDLLIGGLGADGLAGDDGDDLLIADTTAFDANQAALAAIMAEWTSARSYATRVANLRGTGTGSRLNDHYFLQVSGAHVSVFDDGAVDVLHGDGGSDWFFANRAGTLALDVLFGPSGSELVDELTLLLP